MRKTPTAAIIVTGLLAVFSTAFSAAHAGEYVNERYGFAFEMPKSCEEMPAPIFENMLKTISTDKLPSLNQQYVTAIQCDNMPWFEYPYFVVEYRPGDFSRFINEPAPASPKKKPAAAKSTTLNPFEDNAALAEMPAISVDHNRKIIFSAMNASPGGFSVKDMGAGFFREDAMVFLHFYVPNRLAKHFTPLFDHAVTSFRFVETPGSEAARTQPVQKPGSVPAAKPKAVKVAPPQPPVKALPAAKPASAPAKSPPKPSEKPVETPIVIPQPENPDVKPLENPPEQTPGTAPEENMSETGGQTPEQPAEASGPEKPTP